MPRLSSDESRARQARLGQPKAPHLSTWILCLLLNLHRIPLYPQNRVTICDNSILLSYTIRGTRYRFHHESSQRTFGDSPTDGVVRVVSERSLFPNGEDAFDETS